MSKRRTARSWTSCGGSRPRARSSSPDEGAAMRSSASVVRLPKAAKGIAIVRDVRPYGFDEEHAPNAGPRSEEARAAAAEAAPSIEARIAAAREEGRQEGLREGHARGRE